MKKEKESSKPYFLVKFPLLIYLRSFKNLVKEMIPRKFSFDEV